jgi:hypothetical protein
MTPDQVHYGQTDAIHAARQNTLDGAFNRNPECFVRKEPEPSQSQLRPRSIHRKNSNNPSLNSTLGCLKVVDTFRVFPNNRPSRSPAGISAVGTKLPFRVLCEGVATISLRASGCSLLGHTISLPEVLKSLR